MKRVLIACEESQTVCKAFRELGHEAYSCDIQEPSGGHPEWHILGDCLPILGGRCVVTTMDGKAHDISGKWDLLIAHPPCTKIPSDMVEPKANCHEAGTWFMKGGKERQKNRSKTFPGIARAMAEQWGTIL